MKVPVYWDLPPRITKSVPARTRISGLKEKLHTLELPSEMKDSVHYMERRALETFTQVLEFDGNAFKAAFAVYLTGMNDAREILIKEKTP